MKKKKSESTTQRPQSKPLSPGKKWAFRAILILIPILIIVLLELFLRAIEYGGNLDLVVTKELGGKDYYAINRKAAAKYFEGTGTVYPEPAGDIFEIEKSDSAKRIFCLGESTMAGFPYPFNSASPSFLRERLKDIFPDSKIEVVNIGLSAVSSYVVLDFIKELVSYEPDLFIVYLGHNEFYGVYGAGSSIKLPGGHWATNLTIKLLKFRTYLLLRDFISWAQRLIGSGNTDKNVTLMGRMVQEQYIPYGSELYVDAREAYKDNIESIISVAKSNGVPILFSELVSNIKDHPPFHSVFDESISTEEQKKWETLKAAGDSLYSTEEFEEAGGTYGKCTELDTLNASAFYDYGLTNYQLSRYDTAKNALIRAKDLDALRFRVSEDFKHVLKEICEEEGIPLAHVDSAFSAESPHGITGNNLVLEHLHPNMDGYSLMAKVFAQEIINSKLLGKVDSSILSGIKDDDYYILSAGATIFDKTVGKVKVDLLTHKWPFETDETEYHFQPKDEIERIAYKFIEVQISETKARYELADYFWKQKEYDLAHQECYAVAKAHPFSYQPFLKLADYYRMEGKREAAKIAYLRSINIEDNPFARSKLAIMLLEEEQPALAASHLEAGLMIKQKQGISITNEATAMSHYLLGVAYAMSGKLNPARDQLKQSLSLGPGNEKARRLLRKVEQQILSQ